MLQKTSKFLCVAVAFTMLLAPCDGFAATRSKKAKTKPKPKSRPAAARSVAAPAAVMSDRYSAFIVDARTGRILYDVNGLAERHPASLTKMMTLYLAFQALEAGVIRLDTRLPVSALAAEQSPSKLGLKAGQTIAAYDAIMGLVTESANDAAVVLAEALGGSVEQFATLMNRQARALGMNNTNFNNPNGLPDPEQVTTARDMASLGYGLIYHYPGFYPYFSHDKFTYAGRVYNNHNRLMRRYDGMDGIKTGYIRASGFNLVSSAVRGNTRLIGSIFGGTSPVARDNQMARLLDNAFDRAQKARDAATNVSDAQGSNAGDDKGYLPLPSKVAAAFGGGRGMNVVARPAQAPAPSMGARSLQPPPAEQQEELATGTGGWGVQVGAFSDVGTAQTALARMGQNAGHLLKSAEPSLQKLTMSDGSVVYRARYIGMDQQTARAVCTYIVRRGQGCMVVSGL